MSKEICRLEEGTISSHWNTDYLLENLSRKNHENVVYQKLKHLDDVISEYLCLESECSFTKYDSS